MFVAYLRTFTDIPFAKEMAEQSEAEKTFRELAGDRSIALVRLAPYWEARYKLTNRIIHLHSITQILEVAAGLSPRGLAFTESDDIVYVVTDLPQILSQLKSMTNNILTRMGKHRPNLYFAAANALDLDGLTRAAAHFRPERAIAVVTEGLFSYLNADERTVLATNVHGLLNRFGGVWIATEVHSREHLKEAAQLEILRQRVSLLAAPISKTTGRNVETNLFADENELRQFFDEAGFEMEQISYSSVLTELSSVKILNLSAQEILQLEQGFRFFNTLILTRRNG
jgi:O-methyltransferase involved in polyketide biosynthesis